MSKRGRKAAYKSTKTTTTDTKLEFLATTIAEYEWDLTQKVKRKNPCQQSWQGFICNKW
jgi:hypothetical protein